MSVIVFLVLISAANAAVWWLMWLMEEPKPEVPDEWAKRGNPRSYR